MSALAFFFNSHTSRALGIVNEQSAPLESGESSWTSRNLVSLAVPLPDNNSSFDAGKCILLLSVDT